MIACPHISTNVYIIHRTYHFFFFSFENKENKFDVKIDNYLYITVVFCLIKALLLGLLNSYLTNSWKVKIQFERSRKMTIFIISKSSFCLTHFPEMYNLHFFPQISKCHGIAFLSLLQMHLNVLI